jgi:hypothetical protein
VSELDIEVQIAVHEARQKWNNDTSGVSKSMSPLFDSYLRWKEAQEELAKLREIEKAATDCIAGFEKGEGFAAWAAELFRLQCLVSKTRGGNQS